MLFKFVSFAMQFLTAYNPGDGFMTPSGVEEAITIASHLISAAYTYKPRAKLHPRPVEPAHEFSASGAESVLEVELPGVQRKDVEVVVHGRMLVVIGERYRAEDEGVEEAKGAPTAEEAGAAQKRGDAGKEKACGDWIEGKTPGSGEGGAAMHVESDGAGNAEAGMERCPIKVFEGGFRLPRRVDTGKVGLGSYEDGLLRLRLPFHDNNLPRTIEMA